MAARIVKINDYSCVDPAHFTAKTERERQYRERIERAQAVSLNAIEWAASHLKCDAEALSHHARLIEKLPDFVTKSESELEDAEAELAAALRIVGLARKSLAKKRPA